MLNQCMPGGRPTAMVFKVEGGYMVRYWEPELSTRNVRSHLSPDSKIMLTVFKDMIAALRGDDDEKWKGDKANKAAKALDILLSPKQVEEWILNEKSAVAVTDKDLLAIFGKAEEARKKAEELTRSGKLNPFGYGMGSYLRAGPIATVQASPLDDDCGAIGETDLHA